MTYSQSRNFALNPREGLKIPAFKNAQTPEALGDRVLFSLARYLLHIAQVKDFRTLTHKVGIVRCPSDLCLRFAPDTRIGSILSSLYSNPEFKKQRTRNSVPFLTDTLWCFAVSVRSRGACVVCPYIGRVAYNKIISKENIGESRVLRQQ